MENEMKHRWEIAHKGHCRWFYPNHNESTIEIFFDEKSQYNIENNKSYMLNYDSKWYNTFNRLVDNEDYKIRIWKKAEKQGHWYIDNIVESNKVDVKEDVLIVNKAI